MVLTHETDVDLGSNDSAEIEQWFASRVQAKLDLQNTKNIYSLVMNLYYEWRQAKLIPDTFYTDDIQVNLAPFFVEYLRHMYHLYETPGYSKNDSDFDTAEYFGEFFSVLQAVYELKPGSLAE